MQNQRNRNDAIGNNRAEVLARLGVIEYFRSGSRCKQEQKLEQELEQKLEQELEQKLEQVQEQKLEQELEQKQE